MEPLRERLSDLEHAQWAAWTEYFLKVLGLMDADPQELLHRTQLTYPGPSQVRKAVWTREQVDAIMRWRRQIDTPYGELSEKEKDSDREWADKVLTEILK